MATRPLKQADRSQDNVASAGFSLDDVKKLVQLIEKSDVTHIEWEKGPEKVVIKRGNVVVGAPAPFAHAAPIAAPIAALAPVRRAAAPRRRRSRPTSRGSSSPRRSSGPSTGRRRPTRRRSSRWARR